MGESVGSVEALERGIGQLRVAVREAVLSGEKARARTLRAQLRRAEDAWEDTLAGVRAQGTARAAGDNPAPGDTAEAAPGQRPLLPLREQVCEALSLLRVPAAPRLIAAVHEAFFGATFPTQRVTSLRRDEERSFRASPFARPYYICAALAAERLSPSRGLLTISTWPLEKRVIGSLSPRVDFLEAAIRVAEAIERIPGPVPAARRLLVRFAASIPGAVTAVTAGTAGIVIPGAGPGTRLDPRRVRAAAEAELRVHADADTRTRREAARRARESLGDAERFFGVTHTSNDNSNKRAANANRTTPGADT